MKFENTSVWNFENALRGMRNPKNSWEKGDSQFGIYDILTEEKYNQIVPKNAVILRQVGGFTEYIKIGENDLKLAQNLIRAGSEHRKFMRQIFVSVDITAPLFWWSEMDTYKVATVANSTSKMHKLAETPITMDCFEIDDYQDELTVKTVNLDEPYPPIIKATIDYHWEHLITVLEVLRQKYNETKDKRYWKELIRLLPESWLQKRTWTGNYETLLGICSRGQRRTHKLNEWSGKDSPNVPNFISWARTLPYAQELIFLDELKEELK